MATCCPAPTWVVGCPRGSHLVEVCGRCAVRIVRSLQNIRCLRREHDDLRNSARPMPADVPNDFSTAHRMTNQDQVPKIEAVNHGVEIVRQGVQILSMRGSVRGAITPTVIADAAKTVITEKRLLVTPHRAGKSQGVNEQEWAARTPFAMKQPNAVSCLNSRLSRANRSGRRQRA